MSKSEAAPADRHRERAAQVMVDSMNERHPMGDIAAVVANTALALAAVERETIERAAKERAEAVAEEHALCRDVAMKEVLRWFFDAPEHVKGKVVKGTGNLAGDVGVLFDSAYEDAAIRALADSKEG
jgi:hypothetical protein